MWRRWPPRISLIAFSDLAFGWSTTLRFDAPTLEAITHTLALPWQWAWSEAVPTTELIEASRYYRLGKGVIFAGGGNTAETAALLGQWWPFLLMCMAVYGLLPRTLLLTLATYRRRRAVAAAIRYQPAVRRLLDRMNAPVVRTHEEADTEAEAAAPSAEATVATDWPRVDEPVCLINWAQVPVNEAAADRLLADHLGAAPVQRWAAGGERTMADDAAVIERAEDAGAVVMLVRAWEPPMAEVTDFLAQLRAAMQRARPIVVVPVGATENATSSAPLHCPRRGRPTSVSGSASWRRWAIRGCTWSRSTRITRRRGATDAMHQRTCFLWSAKPTYAASPLRGNQ